MKLALNAIIKLSLGLVLVGAMLFLPAGTFAWRGAWLFLAILFIPMLFLGIILLWKAPVLLKSRLDAKEKESAQKGVVAACGLIFPIGFILSGLDFRFGLSSVPLWLVIVSSALFLIGYGLYAEVMRENEYLSRTVKVEEGQRVISSGLYGIVRHPMYAATLLMFIPIPLILGSFWGLIPFSVYLPLIIIRIISEERLLKKELSGYSEYTKRVRYRLLPFIW